MIKNQFFLVIFMVSAAASALTQNLPVDYHNKELLTSQRATTQHFLNFLETGQIDNALNFIEPSYLANKKITKKTLVSYHKELLKYLGSTKLSIVIVFPEQSYNTYRCRYANTNGDYFYIDLYFPVGQPHALIAKMDKLSKKKLAAERKALAKSKKKNAKNDPPPPPPPPMLPPKG